MPSHRITVTLPAELAEELDRAANNRSRFVAEAVRREIERRRREGLLASLANPHDDTAELAETGWTEWAGAVAEGDDALVDPLGGVRVRWSAEEGWVSEA